MLGLAAYGATKAYLYYRAEQRFDTLIAALRPVAEVHYQGVSASVFGDISLLGLELQARGGMPVRVQRLTISDYLPGPAFPRRIRVRAAGMSAPAAELSRWLSRLADMQSTPLPPRLRGALVDLPALGYEQLHGEAWFALDQDPDRGLHAQLGWAVPGAGRLDMQLNMLGVTPLELLGLLPTSGRFEAFTAEYRDASYVPRVVRRLAKREGESADAVRASVMKALVATGWLPDDGNRAAVAAFLADPGRLQVRLQPYRPVALSRLQYYRAEDLPAVLDLRVSAR